jgi:hypothetical protein
MGGRSRLSTLEEPAALAGVGEAHGTCEAGNDGGGTGPHFWVSPRQARVRGLT